MRWFLPFIIFMIQFVSVAAQPTNPPPLAFNRDYSSDYALYDLESQTITEQTRSGNYGESTQFGFSTPPFIFNLTAPERYFGKLIFVDESDRESDNVVEGGYSLFFLGNNGWRQMARGFSLSHPGNRWSPDERYVYLQTNNEAATPYQLLQFEPETETIMPIQGNITRIDCQWYTEHCLLWQQVNRDDANGKLLYLNKLTGEIVPTYEGRLPERDIVWIGSSPQAVWWVETATGEQAIYRFEIDSGATVSVLTLSGERAVTHLALSPDGRRLAITFADGETVIHDLENTRTESLALSSLFDALDVNYRFPVEWLDADTLALTATVDDETGLYTVNVQSSAIERVNATEIDNLDQAWSPDGQWFAYVTQQRELYVVQRDAEAVPLLVVENASCVAWGSEAVSRSGKAFLCDQHWGVG